MVLTHGIIYSEDFNLKSFWLNLNTNIYKLYKYITLKPDVLLYILLNNTMIKSEVCELI